MIIFRVLICLLYAILSSTAFRFKQRVYHLSQPKREIGGAAVDGIAYFGGRCTDTTTPWVCNSPTDVIEVVHPSKGISYGGNLRLSVARGWASTCAVGSKVVFAGGGSSGTEPHSKVADVLDVRRSDVSSNPTALSAGRWGLGCATKNGTIFYAGGKICKGSGCRQYVMTDMIDTVSFSSSGVAKWALSSHKLSHGRESIGVGNIGDGIIYAGGWDGSKSSGIVDIISSSGKVSTFQLNLGFYWIGVTYVNGNIYVVSNDFLYILNRSSTNWISEPLPREMLQGVPNARIPQNGYAVGPLACFYSSKPNAICCYNTIKKLWEKPMECSVPHTAGALVGVSNFILVAGGISDGNVKPTDVVDVYELTI